MTEPKPDAGSRIRPRTTDPFLAMFFSRIPADTAASFDEAQLAAVKMAFGARSFGSHAIDIRRSLPFFGRRVYLVLLAGLERRTRSRIAREHMNRPLWNVMNATIITFGGLVALFALFGALYTIKMALHIDVVPGVDMLPDDLLRSIFG